MACMFHDSCGFEDKRVIGYVQIYVFFGEEKGKADVFLLFIPIIISVPLRLGLHRFLHIGEACFQFVEFLVPFQVELHCEFYLFIHCYFLSFCYICIVN